MRLKEIFASHRAQPTQATAKYKMLKSRAFCTHFQTIRKSRDYCGFLQVITYYQQSIAQLYQFTFKKLQIRFVQNAKILN